MICHRIHPIVDSNNSKKYIYIYKIERPSDGRERAHEAYHSDNVSPVLGKDNILERTLSSTLALITKEGCDVPNQNRIIVVEYN